MPTSYLDVRYEEALDKQRRVKSIICLFRIELNRPSGRKKASDLRSLAFLALKGCHIDLVFLLEQKTLGISIHRSTEICLAVIALAPVGLITLQLQSTYSSNLAALWG